MKKTFTLLSLGIAIVLATACNSKTTTASAVDSVAAPIDSANAAVMAFESSTYDFGKIKEGEKVSFGFKFTNKGKSPLIIQSVASSCGCTVPEYPHEPIAPGDSAEIKVVFNSQGKQGLQNKVVSITSNGIPTSSEVNFVGEVLPSEN